MKTKVVFTAKPAKFGSQKRGEQRAFIVPVEAIDDVLSKFVAADGSAKKCKVTVETI